MEYDSDNAALIVVIGIYSLMVFTAIKLTYGI